MKKIISLVLVVVLTTLALSSCGLNISIPLKYYPKGYTAGFGGLNKAPYPEYYWVETYDELIQAIDQLKAHDSTILETVIFNYEGDLFDTKYCIQISTWGGLADEVKFGDNPFDRWARDVAITPYAFFEDVTIDELVYSYVSDYDVIKLENIQFSETKNMLDGAFGESEFTYTRYQGSYYVDYGNHYLYSITRSKDGNNPTISDDVLDAISGSIVVIE